MANFIQFILAVFGAVVLLSLLISCGLGKNSCTISMHEKVIFSNHEKPK